VVENQLSILIPVYNEKASIIKTIEQLIQTMNASAIQFEIIIVNDGSTDGTIEILNVFTQNHNFNKILKIISHSKNQGYGASLKSGILKAKYPHICITDADSTYPNHEIPSMFEMYMGGYDMVIGQRQFKKLPTITKPAKLFIHMLANFLAGEKILDINSGLRIFKKKIAIKYFPIICDGFSFTTTITLAMITNNYLIKYYPIDYYKRKGKSKIHPVKDTLNFIQLIIRTVLYFDPLKIFIPISSFIFFLAFALFVAARLGFFKESPNDTITILFVGGVQVFVTGMIADLIDKRKKKKKMILGGSWGWKKASLIKI